MAASALLSAPAMVGTVNLSTWTVSGVNQDSVFQSINGVPTVFFDPGSNAQGTALKGEITVTNDVGDDDFVGFVLGYQSDELNSTTADFWLVDWKRGNQTISDGGASREGKRGLALSKVSGDVANAAGTFGGFWDKSGPVSEVQRATNLGDTGWVEGATYEFELIFTPSLIEVKVDGVTELSYTKVDNGGLEFTDGAFGFYNNSQQNVRYAGITDEVVIDPVPLPASALLLIAGLGGLGVMRRRKK